MYHQLDQRISDKEVCLFPGVRSYIYWQFLVLINYLFFISHFIRGLALVLLIECISTQTVAYLSLTI
jgi:hypothetical protein